MPIHRTARLLLVLIATTILPILVGPPALANDDENDARAILATASERLADTQTMKFELDIEGDSWIDDTHTMRLIAARGDLARPDKVDVEFQLNLLGAQNVSIRMITVGDSAWTTDLLTGKWGPAPPEFGYNPAVLFDNQNGLGPVANRLQHPTVEGDESIGGRDAWQITGTVDAATIEPLTSGVIGGDEIGIAIWVDKETSNILRIEIHEPPIDGKDRPAVWTMTLTDHDGDIEIVAPDTGD